MRRRHFWGSSVQNTSAEGFEDSTLRWIWGLLHSPRSWQVGTAGHPCTQTCDYKLWLLISVPQTDGGTKASEDTHVNGSVSARHWSPGTAAGRGRGPRGCLEDHRAASLQSLPASPLPLPWEENQTHAEPPLLRSRQMVTGDTPKYTVCHLCSEQPSLRVRLLGTGSLPRSGPRSCCGLSSVRACTTQEHSRGRGSLGGKRAHGAQQALRPSPGTHGAGPALSPADMSDRTGEGGVSV